MELIENKFHLMISKISYFTYFTIIVTLFIMKTSENHDYLFNLIPYKPFPRFKSNLRNLLSEPSLENLISFKSYKGFWNSESFRDFEKKKGIFRITFTHYPLGINSACEFSLKIDLFDGEYNKKYVQILSYFFSNENETYESYPITIKSEDDYSQLTEFNYLNDEYFESKLVITLRNSNELNINI